MRGNTRGFELAASAEKCVEMHNETNWSLLYAKYGQELQKRFFGHFLKGEDTGWESEPPVALNIRHPVEKFERRGENEWPLARTQWTKYFLAPDGLGLGPDLPAEETTLSYETTGEGITFRTLPSGAYPSSQICACTASAISRRPCPMLVSHMPDKLSK